MPKISEIMTLNPVSLSQLANVNRARLLLVEKKIRHLPVKDTETGKLIGILSQKAVLANAIKIVNQRGFDDLEHVEKSMEIAQIMNTQPVICDINDAVSHVAQKLLSMRSGCIAIEDQGKLVGVVTSSDFVKLAIKS